MKIPIRLFISTACMAILASCDRPQAESKPLPVRAAVIGGMSTTGLWDFMAAEFTKRTGIPVEVAAAGPKEVLDEAFRAGGIDLVTMHSSDTATKLAAEGFSSNLRPWACNELVIVGPQEDPAGIRGLKEGTAALRKIAETKTPFVEARNTGSQTVSIALWRKLGINPTGDWMLKDESQSRWQVVEFARQRGAYVIVGRIPVVSGKLASPGMEVLVEGDPMMRRPYVVAEAVASKTGARNPDGARRLADFLTSTEGQRLLSAHAARRNDGKPVFFPVQPCVPEARNRE